MTKLLIEVDPQDERSVRAGIAALQRFVPPTNTPDTPDAQSVPIDVAIEEAHSEPKGISAGSFRDLVAATQAKRPIATLVHVPAPVPSASVDDGDLITTLQGYVNSHGFAAAVVLLQEFGVARVTELPSEKRAEFVARVQAA